MIKMKINQMDPIGRQQIKYLKKNYLIKMEINNEIIIENQFPIFLEKIYMIKWEINQRKYCIVLNFKNFLVLKYFYAIIVNLTYKSDKK